MIRHRILPAVAVLSVAALAGCASGPQGWRFREAPPFAAEGKFCKDTTFAVYFDRGSDHLTAEAQALVGAVGGQLKGCRVRSAEVVGIAVAGADEQVSADLARRRADAVALTLAAANLPAPKTDLVAEGASPRRGAEPLRRRTEVILKVTPA